MAIQLYDLSVAPKSDKNDLSFVMRAPLPVIARYLRLHIDAVRRIERETENTSLPCFLYGPSGTDEVHVVWRPIYSLSTTAVR